MTATMKKVSAASDTKKPTTLRAATQTANAAQVANARPAPAHSILSESLLLRLEITSASDSAAMAMPYHSGKNPGPGPSGPRYSQRAASETM
jgi:hypothetical protein